MGGKNLFIWFFKLWRIAIRTTLTTISAASSTISSRKNCAKKLLWKKRKNQSSTLRNKKIKKEIRIKNIFNFSWNNLKYNNKYFHTAIKRKFQSWSPWCGKSRNRKLVPILKNLSRNYRDNNRNNNQRLLCALRLKTKTLNPDNTTGLSKSTMSSSMSPRCP